MLFLSGLLAWTVERIAEEATSGLTQVAMQRAERLSGSASPPKLRSLLTQFFTRRQMNLCGSHSYMT